MTTTVHDPTHPRDIDGLIPEGVGEALAMLAVSVDSADAIVEIGSYRGKSAAYLADGASRDRPPGTRPTVYAVDPWDLQDDPGKHGYNTEAVRQDFVWNIEAAGYAIGEDVVPIQGYSVEVAEAWPQADWIGLLFIDAHHTDDGVMADWSAWRPHLSAGAVVAFDDLDTPRNPGVRVAYDRILAANPDVRLSGILAGRLGVIWT